MKRPIGFHSTFCECIGKFTLDPGTVIAKCIRLASFVIKFEIPQESSSTKGKFIGLADQEEYVEHTRAPRFGIGK